MSAQSLGEKAAYSLLNVGSITTIATGGVYVTQVKQKKGFPQVLITEEGVRPQDTKSDAQGVGATTNIHFMTISCYAKSNDILASLRQAVDLILNHFSGTTNSVVVDDIRFINSDTDWVEDIKFADMDYEIWTKQ